MKKWINFPLQSGKVSQQAHADFPQNTFEREMGKEGFFGPATHFYHQHAPTGWSNFSGPLSPHAFDCNHLTDTNHSPWQAEILLNNASCPIRFWHCDTDMDYLVRNADGDTLLFTHSGAGNLFCDFGQLSYQAGEYILIPRGTMWRLEPQQVSTFLIIESFNQSLRLPDKGIMGEHAIFDPGVLKTPEINEQFLQQQDENEWQVLVKARNKISTITYPFNPLDAIGWKGHLTVVSLHWQDIRPVMSHRYHLPPSVHSTFVADDFVVCTFVPRPIESDPGALKVPFYHNNDDFDELIFYHQGEFFSRDNIHPGMMTLHPMGFTHGPHPKAFQAGAKSAKTFTDEVAVMIDSKKSWDVTEHAEKIEWMDYVHSWKS